VCVHHLCVASCAGTFAPNFTIGPPVVAAMRKHSSMFLDCHLAVSVSPTHVLVKPDCSQHLSCTGIL
jgi:pentose-5-phosphate-3-epimerase